MAENSNSFRISIVQEKSEQTARPTMTNFTTILASMNIAQASR